MISTGQEIQTNTRRILPFIPVGPTVNIIRHQLAILFNFYRTRNRHGLTACCHGSLPWFVSHEPYYLFRFVRYEPRLESVDRHAADFASVNLCVFVNLCGTGYITGRCTKRVFESNALWLLTRID